MMGRGLLLLALVMVLAGAYAIVNGAGMILNERGWSQVIAGSVVMTGGFIVAALTALLHEMQKNAARTLVHDRSESPVVTSPVVETTVPSSIASASALSTPVLSDAAVQAQFKPHAQDTYSQDPQPHDAAAAYHAPEPIAAQAERDAHDHAHETIITPPAADYDHISPVASAHAAQEPVNFAPEPVASAADVAVARPQLRQPTLFELVQEQAPLSPPPASTPAHPMTMPQQMALAADLIVKNMDFKEADELAARLTEVGLATGEKVWRMPLGPEYDKLIDSKFADMKNTGGRFGGAITAAQFLQRFIKSADTPWAHIDIAGVAWSSKGSSMAPKGATAFGVRLLDTWIADNYG